MHIGLVIYGSLSNVSGGYLYDKQLVERLIQRGNTVEIISLPWRSYPRHLEDNFSPPLLRRLMNLPVDLLLQDELNHPSLFRLNRLVRQQAAYPLISIVHHLRSNEAHPAWAYRLYRRVEQRYLKGIDGFIFNSQTTQRAVEALVGAQRPSVVAYPAGDRLRPEMPKSEVLQRARQPGPLRLLFLGNVIRRKGLHTVIDALSRLPAGECSLTVAGSLEAEPGYARQVRAQANKDGLMEQVRFCGQLDDNALAARLRASHLVVVPSSYEGFGIAYLEGMAFGLPAVGTTRGAAGELIIPGKNGFLVPPDDPQSLATVLHQMAVDRPALVRLSLGALEHYRQHPTWEKSMGIAAGFLESFALNWYGREPTT